MLKRPVSHPTRTNADFESLRREFEPAKVRCLLVGESRPNGGTFFYDGNSNLFQHTKQAFEELTRTVETTSQFLDRFSGLGFYLIDLCDSPVNQLPDTKRMAAREAGVKPLASELARHSPEAIITVMLDIVSPVQEAIALAGHSSVPFYALPFPRRHSTRYVERLKAVLNELGLMIGRQTSRG